MKLGNVFFGIGLIAGVALLAKYALDLVHAFQFKIVGYGVPSFENWTLTLPITLQFTNPTGLKITTDDVRVDLYLKNASGQPIHVGHVQQPMEIPAGSSNQTVIPIVNLQNAAGVVINSWQDILAKKKVDIVTDVTVTYKGLTLPRQRFEDKISI